MSDRLSIALAQVNPTVGDLDGNAALVRRRRAEAARQGADLVVIGVISCAEGSQRRGRWFGEDPRYEYLEMTSAQVGVISWATTILVGS